MLPLQLDKIKFPPRTTDEEKIIFARTRGFSTRQIRDAFHFGNTKISEVIKEYKRTGVVQKPKQNHKPTKLTHEVLLKIHTMMMLMSPLKQCRAQFHSNLIWQYQ